MNQTYVVNTIDELRRLVAGVLDLFSTGLGDVL